ncbi:hypothetical protein O9K63_11445 [Janibacter cremeus]|uniref:hypothetical protein n=1 Tax=Janibacter cremeus TaxID=1285192 RepID=UPI0023F707B2|nr:hypothetical protein [Janibacter cremeus]WEV77205.1 hypothetical protein O9K63_11445 [Janibacter cremeus]
MGVTRLLARLAVRSARVLVVEAPGQWLTRVELEQQMLRRGWGTAWTPADADVLAVCGAPGPELADLTERLWDQMPGPRARADIPSPSAVDGALDAAASLLLDTSYHRADARERAQKPQVTEDHEDMDHGDMDHEGMDHGDMDHEGMDHGDMDHEGMDHGDMDMAPEGIALAEGGEDRDGLEMDVLHLPLGPVLPFWPAGLVLLCSLQGDVVVDAEGSVVDGPGGLPSGGEPEAPPASAMAARCDGVVALLALTGAGRATTCARRARDALLRDDRRAAREAIETLHRTVRTSWLLRWSLRGVLTLDQSDLARHGLPQGCGGDAHDRLSSMVDRLRTEIADAEAASAASHAVPWEKVPQLVVGLELATARLAVASVGMEPFLVDQGVGHA